MTELEKMIKTTRDASIAVANEIVHLNQDLDERLDRLERELRFHDQRVTALRARWVELEDLYDQLCLILEQQP